MKFNINARLVFCTLLLLNACASSEPYFKEEQTTEKQEIENNSEIDSEIFLVGDIGKSANINDQADVVALIKNQLDATRDNQAVVFLGNTIDRGGLPDEHEAARRATVESMKLCMNELKSASDKVYFIPGNYEWFNGRTHTIEALQETENFMEELGGKKMLQPENACGEPKVVELTDDLVLVLIDSQWLIQGDESDERTTGGCSVDNNSQFMIAFQDVLKRNKRKNVIVAAHHPIYSNGKIAGNYPVKNHLLPLPIVGSLVTGFRKLGASPQEFGHPKYEAYRTLIKTVMDNFEGVTFVSGHENNLQYKKGANNHFVIAGSGSAVDYVRKGGEMDFSYMHKGFAKIIHYKNLEMWLEFVIPDSNNPKGKVVYRKQLYKKVPPIIKPQQYHEADSFCPATIKIEASKIYSGKNKWLFGEHYRKTWSTPIEVSTILLDNEHGGLKVVQEGGGFQTKSLRLENENGEQYVLRTIDKDLTSVIPAELRNTVAHDLIQDGISASHPYAFLVVAELAKSAKIYHTNPRVVFVPAQAALGEYNDDYANKIYLYEERVGGNIQQVESFGNASKTISSFDLIDKIQKSENHVVDQKWTMKSRLFDLVIGDWDRHEDQWRWGVFEEGEKKRYRPIPRDRDQAFFYDDGLIYKIGAHPYFNPQLRIYENEPDYMGGLVFNARFFDHTFLNAITREEALEMAKELQENLTDEKIEAAFKVWPTEIQELDAASIIEKVKYRRDHLLALTNQYVDVLEENRAIHGTKESDEFVIESLENNQLKISVFMRNEDSKDLIYTSIINGNTTKEIRLYGLKGKDTFLYTGAFPSTVKIRIVGGKGEDAISNETNNKLLAYDTPKGIDLKGSQIKDKTSNERGVNDYNRKDWNLNRTIHFPLPTFYTDEGLGLQYNLWIRNYGFRKTPYKQDHKLSAAFFTKNEAFLFRYVGSFKQVFRKWDFEIDAVTTGPSFIQYYYGLGNNYVDFQELFPQEGEAGEKSFHMIKGTHVDINPKFVLEFKNGQKISINPSYEFFDFDNSDSESRLYLSPNSGVSVNELKSKNYAALGFSYSINRIDNPGVPSRGFVFNIASDYKVNTQESEFNNLTFSSELSAYIPFNQRKSIVLAMNLGGAHTEGDIEVFHYNYLANKSRLRGFKTNRFAGESMAYHATDLRITLLERHGDIPFGLGIFGAFDYGRVWFDGTELTNDSDKWHSSVGGGIFITPFKMLGFKLGYYEGEDDSQLNIGGALRF